VLSNGCVEGIDEKSRGDEDMTAIMLSGDFTSSTSPTSVILTSSICSSQVSAVHADAGQAKQGREKRQNGTANKRVKERVERNTMFTKVQISETDVPS
jgi:hypothetical protein